MKEMKSNLTNRSQLFPNGLFSKEKAHPKEEEKV